MNQIEVNSNAQLQPKEEDNTISSIKRFNNKDKTLDFHIKEYDSIRSGLAEDIKEIQMTKLYCLVGAGAVWTWLATHPDITVKTIWLLPFVFGLLGAINTYRNYIWIRRSAVYLRKLEEAICDPEILIGWENHLNRVRDNIAELFSILFWVIFISTTILVYLKVVGII